MPSFDIVLLLVFFVYGFAFLTLGIILAVESGHFSALADAKILRPLAIFGILHGTHEWVDAYLLQSEALKAPLPDWLAWLRLFLLTVSFIFLIVFDIQAFRLRPHRFNRIDALVVSVLGLYILLISFSTLRSISMGEVAWKDIIGILPRYLLGVPGAILAAFELRLQAVNSKGKEHHYLLVHLTVAAVGFGIYGLAQIFVSPVNIFPANYVNSAVFREWAGFPIQMVRTGAAILITLGLVRSTQLADRERQRQIQNAQKAHLDAIEERDQYRHELLLHTVRAQEEERARIARELHDETSQVLTAFSLDLATLGTRITKNKEAKRLVDRLQSLSKQISQRLYRLVHDLRPAELDDLGLIPAIHYLKDSNSVLGLNVSLEVHGQGRRLDAIVETVLFRVVQEALNNALRHANVADASVSLDFCQDEIVLRIMDKGEGFDPQKPLTPPHGWGIAGMRERVGLIGGRLTIISSPGSGTTVEVIVPNSPLFMNAKRAYEEDPFNARG